MNTTKELFHPILHYISGKRLYFILLEFKYDAIEKGTRVVNNILPNLEVKHNVCAYSIFGDLDLLIRIWASDEEVRQLAGRISSMKEITSRRIILVDNIHTWYQDRIEQTIPKTAPCLLSEKEMNSIVSGRNNVNDSLILNHLSEEEDKYLYKFWIFAEEPFPSSNTLFEDLKRKLSKKINLNPRQDSEWAGTYRMSFYSYSTATHQGVIVKADSSSFIESCGSLDDVIAEHAKDKEIKIKTYIARSRIVEEGDLIAIGSSNPGAQRKIALRNLCSSHDCGFIVYEKDSKEEKEIDAFIDCLTPHFYDLFSCFSFDGWQRKVFKLRVIYKWVVEKKDKKIESYLLKEYVDLERQLREKISSVMSKDKKIPRSFMREWTGFHSTVRRMSNMLNIDEEDAIRFLEGEEGRWFSRKITFGEMPSALKFINRRLNNSKDIDRDIFSNLQSLITASAKDRNALAHGETGHLFQLNDDDTNLVWEGYVVNFLKLSFYSTYALQSLSKIKSLQVD
ncbi:MAG: hypothetical protein AB4050_10705 [Synechococcus sp.]